MSSASVRAAACHLRIHHSTAQERSARATRMLGRDVDEPDGRLRLQLALIPAQVSALYAAGT